jgi:hypothetical protein
MPSGEDLLKKWLKYGLGTIVDNPKECSEEFEELQRLVDETSNYLGVFDDGCE